MEKSAKNSMNRSSNKPTINAEDGFGRATLEALNKVAKEASPPLMTEEEMAKYR